MGGTKHDHDDPYTEHYAYDPVHHHHNEDVQSHHSHQHDNFTKLLEEIRLNEKM